MAWAGTPPVPPVGFELATIQRGDTLQSLCEEAIAKRLHKGTTVDVVARAIAKANGVDDPGRRTCNWARDLGAWILTTGGFRQDVVDGSNKCEPGKGHVSFAEGQRIYLPVGLRAPAGPPQASEGITATKVGLGLGGAALIGVGALVAKNVFFPSKKQPARAAAGAAA